MFGGKKGCGPFWCPERKFGIFLTDTIVICTSWCITFVETENFNVYDYLKTGQPHVVNNVPNICIPVQNDFPQLCPNLPVKSSNSWLVYLASSTTLLVLKGSQLYEGLSCFVILFQISNLLWYFRWAIFKISKVSNT